MYVARAKPEVHADRRARAGAVRISVRRDHARGRFRAEVPFCARDREVLAADSEVGLAFGRGLPAAFPIRARDVEIAVQSEVRELYVHYAEVQPADASGDLCARANVEDVRVPNTDRVRVDADLAREERHAVRIRDLVELDLLADAPEVEDAGVLQEEVARLGEEQREAVEIHLTCVDVGIGEVRVEGERARDGGCDLVEGVEARIERPVVAVLDRAVDLVDVALEEATDGAGEHHIEAAARCDALDVRECARLRHVERKFVLPPGCPAALFVEPAHAACDVEAPARLRGIERESLEWERELAAPALGIDSGFREPDAVPLLTHRLVVLDQRFPAPAVHVGREHVAVALVMERVDGDEHAIVAALARVAPHHLGDQLLGLGIPGAHRDVEELVVVENSHVGGVAGLGALVRALLRERAERGGVLPGGIVEAPVDLRRLYASRQLPHRRVGRHLAIRRERYRRSARLAQCRLRAEREQHCEHERRAHSPLAPAHAASFRVAPHRALARAAR